MNRRTFLSRALAAPLFGQSLALLAPLRAGQPGPPLSLFDGRTLAGWHRLEHPKNEKYTGARWLVADHAICGQQFPPGDDRGGMLLSDARYGDFDLTVDIRPDWGCDTGLILRTNADGVGLQVLIDYLPGGSVGFLHGQGIGYISSAIELAGNPDGSGIRAVDAYDAVRHDGLRYAANAAQWNAAWRAGDWNTLRVRCTGKHPDMTTWINGVKICEMQSATFRPRHLTEVRKRNWDAPSAFDREKIHALLGRTGHIALQVHPGNRWAKNGFTRYRNFALRPLRPDRE